MLTHKYVFRDQRVRTDDHRSRIKNSVKIILKPGIGLKLTFNKRSEIDTK